MSMYLCQCFLVVPETLGKAAGWEGWVPANGKMLRHFIPLMYYILL